MLRNLEKNRANVKILLADNDSYMRQGLRNAFGSEGYQNVRTVGKISTLREILMSSLPDLLIIDIDTPDGDAVETVTDIRSGKIGKNPFMPIIFATWDSDPVAINRAVQSGVDLILAKPLAPAQLFKRIESLITDRKPFIATNRYFGPERRPKDRQGDIPHFEVPNTLKDKMEGRPVDPTALAETVGALMHQMQTSRLETSAMLLHAKVEEVCKAHENDMPLKDIGEAIAMISRTADDIRRLGKGDITKLSASLVRIAGPLLRGEQDIGEQEIELLRPLSQSILLASKPHGDDPTIMAEISKAVSRFAPKKRPAPAPVSAASAKMASPEQKAAAA